MLNMFFCNYSRFSILAKSNNMRPVKKYTLWYNWMGLKKIRQVIHPSLIYTRVCNVETAHFMFWLCTQNIFTSVRNYVWNMYTNSGNLYSLTVWAKCAMISLPIHGNALYCLPDSNNSINSLLSAQILIQIQQQLKIQQQFTLLVAQKVKCFRFRMHVRAPSDVLLRSHVCFVNTEMWVLLTRNIASGSRIFHFPEASTDLYRLQSKTPPNKKPILKPKTIKIIYLFK